MRNLACIPNLSNPRRHCDIAGCEHLAAEDKCLLSQSIPNALWANLQWISRHVRPTSQSKRINIWHTKICANPADLNCNRSFAREAMGKRAYIRRSTANVNDHRIFQARKKSRAAHRVRRTRCKCEHRILLCKIRTHKSAIVLGKIQRSANAKLLDGTPKCSNRLCRKYSQAGI